MHKKLAAHTDVKKTNTWRNFFWLYSISLTALYIYLTTAGYTEQPLSHIASEKPGAHSSSETFKTTHTSYNSTKDKNSIVKTSQ
jgi:hypothetical protein